MIFKNPYYVPPRFDAASTDALLTAMRNNAQIAEFTLQQARNAVPALAEKSDGYVQQCLHDAFAIAANERNVSTATPTQEVYRWSWRDFIA